MMKAESLFHIYTVNEPLSFHETVAEVDRPKLVGGWVGVSFGKQLTGTGYVASVLDGTEYYLRGCTETNDHPAIVFHYTIPGPSDGTNEDLFRQIQDRCVSLPSMICRSEKTITVRCPIAGLVHYSVAEEDGVDSLIYRYLAPWHFNPEKISDGSRTRIVVDLNLEWMSEINGHFYPDPPYGGHRPDHIPYLTCLLARLRFRGLARAANIELYRLRTKKHCMSNDPARMYPWYANTETMPFIELKYLANVPMNYRNKWTADFPAAIQRLP